MGPHLYFALFAQTKAGPFDSLFGDHKIKRERGEETALLVSGQLSASHVVQLTESIAYLAADMSLLHGLAMADAIVYATARDQDTQVVTGDADLKDLPGVIYVK